MFLLPRGRDGRARTACQGRARAEHHPLCARTTGERGGGARPVGNTRASRAGPRRADGRERADWSVRHLCRDHVAPFRNSHHRRGVGYRGGVQDRTSCVGGRQRLLQILFYFCQAPAPPPSTSDEIDQLGRVFDFRQELTRHGLVWDYPDHSAFADTVRPHLVMVLGRMLHGDPSRTAALNVAPVTPASDLELARGRSRIWRPSMSGSDGRCLRAMSGRAEWKWWPHECALSLCRPIHCCLS